MTDTYRDWDAAYLLGSLSPAERREFEDHLADCPRCSAAVAELAGLPGLLSMVPVDEVDPVEEVPKELLPRLVTAARRRRTRVRALTGGLVVAAAAAAVAVTLVLPQIVPADPGEHSAELTLSQVVASPLSADVRLIVHDWGTSIEMTCRYAGDYGGTGGPGGSGADYAMYVTDSAGEATQLATWTAMPGSTVEPSGTTSLTLDEIRSVEVRSVESGAILLAGSP
ncbi:zf-HC2 domain-containing protein [Leifsonia bigeumensis]|uniref:Zf-HC2 domain-containing protein n=1 Tax=Leifsonella bigeumensis TaxID=433643 RepID=A0ABP7FJ29_9MICO